MPPMRGTLFYFEKIASATREIFLRQQNRVFARLSVPAPARAPKNPTERDKIREAAMFIGFSRCSSGFGMRQKMTLSRGGEDSAD
jgi:hypothetical protein